MKHKESIRAVVYYRALNPMIKRSNSRIPRQDETFYRLVESTVFSSLDLKTEFHQVSIRHEHIDKTAFKTKFGQFEYLVMSMGLFNAPETFQPLMNTIFHDCIDYFMVFYMDDLLVFIKTKEEHLQHLENVLLRLPDEHLFVSPNFLVDKRRN